LELRQTAPKTNHTEPEICQTAPKYNPPNCTWCNPPKRPYDIDLTFPMRQSADPKSDRFEAVSEWYSAIWPSGHCFYGLMQEPGGFPNK